MGECVRGDNQTFRQVMEQIGPRRRIRREARRQRGNVQQNRINPFHNREPGQAARIRER